MRWSRLFIPTLRETPADAEVASHRLLLRAGLVRQLGAGIYSYLPLAQRCLRKIEEIVRQEMSRIGAQEFLLPALHPSDLWEESGRWTTMGDNMFRLRDRGGRNMCLGMTHEEIFTGIARSELRSYRDLPQVWFQIQNKFRDEPRPKSGLLRVRQFTMKDSYSFDLDAKGLDRSYQAHDGAYRAIFDRCGLQYLAVEADSGAMGGSESKEFVVKSEAGEDLVVTCSCGYSANLDRARSKIEATEDATGAATPQPIHTPGQKTIQQISDYLKIDQNRQIKSIVYQIDGQPHLLLLRGDHQLNEVKLMASLGTTQVRPAHPEEIVAALGASAGSLGPVGAQLPLLADQALQGRRDLVCGANRDDYHLLHVTPGRDFEARYFDLRQVEAGEACIECGLPLEIHKAVEVGHIFKLGYFYSRALGLKVLDKKGRKVDVIMGSYGIGIERIMVAAMELYHDELGIVWPRSIAPFEVIVTSLGQDSRQQAEAESLYKQLLQRGIDCLLDDRQERPGVKFKDAELIGIPLRLTVGRKLAQGQVELFSRAARLSQDVAVNEAVDTCTAWLEKYPL